MYNIDFEDLHDHCVRVRSTESLDDALGFALSLHKSSNVDHLVTVDDDSGVFVQLLYSPVIEADSSAFVRGIVKEALGDNIDG